jgi:hypothetical protein
MTAAMSAFFLGKPRMQWQVAPSDNCLIAAPLSSLGSYETHAEDAEGLKISLKNQLASPSNEKRHPGRDAFFLFPFSKGKCRNA